MNWRRNFLSSAMLMLLVSWMLEIKLRSTKASVRWCSSDSTAEHQRGHEYNDRTWRSQHINTECKTQLTFHAASKGWCLQNLLHFIVTLCSDAFKGGCGEHLKWCSCHLCNLFSVLRLYPSLSAVISSKSLTDTHSSTSLLRQVHSWERCRTPQTNTQPSIYSVVVWVESRKDIFSVAPATEMRSPGTLVFCALKIAWKEI